MNEARTYFRGLNEGSRAAERIADRVIGVGANAMAAVLVGPRARLSAAGDIATMMDLKLRKDLIRMADETLA
jgi:hypothetical protein